MNKIIYPILLALFLLVPGSALATTDFKVFVASDTTHELGLKATQMLNGQILPASNFVVSPESVVQVNQGKNLMVFTSTNQPEKIEKVKVIDAKGITTELLPLQSNQYSISGLNVGVYTLNVIVDNGNGKNAYETLLIILAPDQQPIQKTEITKIVQKTKVYVEIDFREEEECRPGYSYNEKTGNCEKINVCTTGILHEDKGCSPLPRPPVLEPCTPDGGECPPCPEGEEGSHCMDEDERQDGEDELLEYFPPTDETEDRSEGDDESLEEGNGSEDEETESEGQDDEVDFGADAEN